MNRLTVFYDPRCGLCCATRDWIARQAQLVPLRCRPKPDLSDELVVVADTGEVWSGDSAWLIVLWALSAYRPWALRLSSPSLLPVAKRMFKIVSGYRGPISCRLGLVADEQVTKGEAALSDGS